MKPEIRMKDEGGKHEYFHIRAFSRIGMQNYLILRKRLPFKGIFSFVFKLMSSVYIEIKIKTYFVSKSESIFIQ